MRELSNDRFSRKVSKEKFNETFRKRNCFKTVLEISREIIEKVLRVSETIVWEIFKRISDEITNADTQLTPREITKKVYK